jgi:hypothetical protein
MNRNQRVDLDAGMADLCALAAVDALLRITHHRARRGRTDRTVKATQRTEVAAPGVAEQHGAHRNETSDRKIDGSKTHEQRQDLYVGYCVVRNLLEADGLGNGHHGYPREHCGRDQVAHSPEHEIEAAWKSWRASLQTASQPAEAVPHSTHRTYPATKAALEQERRGKRANYDDDARRGNDVKEAGLEPEEEAHVRAHRNQAGNSLGAINICALAHRPEIEHP